MDAYWDKPAWKIFSAAISLHMSGIIEHLLSLIAQRAPVLTGNSVTLFFYVEEYLLAFTYSY